MPPIFCVQRKGVKCVPTEADIIKSNKESFGDTIGSTTNVITSQICLQARFPKESKEYKELEYRILCGQLFQQNAIDAAKGIIAKPMPKYWYDNSENKIDPDDPIEVQEEKKFRSRICADKKPYFFIYNYSALLKEYKAYIKEINKSCLREFNKTIDELSSFDNLTLKEKEALNYYNKSYPVNKESCLVNEICWLIEKEFTDIKKINKPFDKEILKSGVKYSPKEKRYIMECYLNYNDMLYKKIKKDQNFNADFSTLNTQFKIKCLELVPDEEKILDILIDIAYSNNVSKQMIWMSFGDTLINNLLKKNDYKYSIPIPDPSGDIEFCGEKFSMKKFTIKEESYEDNNE